MTTRTGSPPHWPMRFVHQQWHHRTITGDIDDLLALYHPDGVLESPLVPRLFDRGTGVTAGQGVLVGHAEIREFLERGTSSRPTGRARFFHRSEDFLFEGTTLFWEYPRTTPDGDQTDLAEVMDLDGRRIRHHRVYWGWHSLPLLDRR